MSEEHNPYAAPQAAVGDPAAGPVSVPAAPSGPNGIGGWLILPLLGLIFTPFRIALDTVRELGPVLRADTWAVLTTPGGRAYDPMWAPVIVFELAANIALIVFCIVALTPFIQKRRYVPKVMVAWFLTVAGVQVVDLLLTAQIPAIAHRAGIDTLGGLIRTSVSAGIWVPYFLLSKRVQNTFVR